MNTATVWNVKPDVISGRLRFGSPSFKGNPVSVKKITARVVDSKKRLSVLINTSDEMNIGTFWNVKPDIITG